METGRTFGERGVADRGKVAADHGCPAHEADRDIGSPGDGILHDSRRGALPQLAEDQCSDEPLLRRGGGRHEVGKELATPALRPGSGRPGNVGECLIDLVERERWLKRRVCLDVVDERVADADLPLGELSAQIGHHERDQIGRRLFQEICDRADLRQA